MVYYPPVDETGTVNDEPATNKHILCNAMQNSYTVGYTDRYYNTTDILLIVGIT